MSIEKGMRTRLTTVFILFLVLVAGSVLGIAMDRRLHAKAVVAERSDGGSDRQRASGEANEAEGEAGEASRPRRLIVEQVGLSDDQKVQIDSIVGHYRQKMRDLQGELQAELQAAYTPRYRELLEATRTEVKAVLSPGQQAAYDSLLAEHDQRRAQRQSRDSVPGSRGEGRD